MDTKDKYIGILLDGRYEIAECIGEGGMAVVYKGLDHRLNRYVAVKIMRDEMAEDEEFRSRFCAEAHAVAMLSHPNIIGVYDVSHSDDIEYIVMELVDGITLRQYMDKKGVIGWKEALHFSRQICRALSHAHEHGIIHRDIKPQNIMMLKDGTIKVGDFGIAALENELNEENSETVGSIHYIAPEQAKGQNPDARSDIYSLGIVMYEMLTATKPYVGETAQEIAVKHISGLATSPRNIVENIPEEFERITLKAMSAELDNRYQSAAHLLLDLDNFGQSQIRAEEAAKNALIQDSIAVSVSNELSKSQYIRSRKRSAKVSFLSGLFLALVMAIALFSFVWNFWLSEVFSPAQRIPLPDFVGINYEALTGNAEIASMYKFNVTYVINTDAESGLILAQDPDPGRSMMITSDGIEVKLSVSTGVVLSEVPDVLNKDYREATKLLTEAGFLVEIENSTSESITRNYVINISPTVGEKISSGSKVYVVVSTGPEVNFIAVPNLLGLSEEAAINKIESSGLSYGGTEYVASDLDVGIVIAQSPEKFTSIEEHTKIFLTVSLGS